MAQELEKAVNPKDSSTPLIWKTEGSTFYDRQYFIRLERLVLWVELNLESVCYQSRTNADGGETERKGVGFLSPDHLFVLDGHRTDKRKQHENSSSKQNSSLSNRMIAGSGAFEHESLKSADLWSRGFDRRERLTKFLFYWIVMLFSKTVDRLPLVTLMQVSEQLHQWSLTCCALSRNAQIFPLSLSSDFVLCDFLTIVHCFLIFYTTVGKWVLFVLWEVVGRWIRFVLNGWQLIDQARHFFMYALRNEPCFLTARPAFRCFFYLYYRTFEPAHQR